MDSANQEEALREIKLDLEEGADLIMIKPALSYLDVIHAAKASFHIPIAAYNVSGEYSMIKAASAMGYLDERKAVTEILTSINRAGANVILSYHTKDVAAWAKEAGTPFRTLFEKP